MFTASKKYAQPNPCEFLCKFRNTKLSSMRILILLFLLLGTAYSKAQEDVLPRGLTNDETKILESYYENYQPSARGITSAPTGDLRTAAEWEEIQALVITWTGQFPEIHSQIVGAADGQCEVIIVCSDSTDVKSDLSGNGVSDAHCIFIEAPFNSIWIRDYAANTVYKDGVDDLLLVDWIYNRPRPDDDVIPALHATELGIDLYETSVAPTDLVNTGGNFMSDGFGTAFASELILEENMAGNPYGVTTKSETDIDLIMQNWQGLDRYIKMPVLPYDGIHHIDMHMKLLDEETLLISEYPTGVADGPQIEANLQYVISNFNSTFGTPFEVIRITVPPSTGGAYPDNGGYYRTYTNGTFVNKNYIFPTYREEYDTVAYRVLGEALPGYNLIGIDVDDFGSNLIQYSGAIHCITHSVGVEDPLLISHQPLDDTYDTVNDYPVTAFMKHRSGMSGGTLYWTTDTTAGWQTVSLSNTSNDDWAAAIPAQPAGTRVYYYVEGNAVSGKSQVRPITAPAGFWHFDVLMTVGIEDTDLASVEMGDPFPNPANAITAIPVDFKTSQEVGVELQDLSGRTVKQIHNGSVSAGKQHFFFDAIEFDSGMYQVVITGESKRYTKRVVIAH